MGMYTFVRSATARQRVLFYFLLTNLSITSLSRRRILTLYLFSPHTNIMTETGKVRWTIHRPGRTWTDLAHLASRFGVFRPASVTMKGDPGSLILHFAGETTKSRPHINGCDNECLAGPLMFIPYSKAPRSSPTSSNATRQGDLFMIDPADGCVSHIRNAIYEPHEDKTISLHDPSLEGRLMCGGDFVGGTQREVQGVPGSIYLEGAKFTMRKYWNPDRPRYGTQQNTSMTATDTSGSQSKKRPSAANTISHERAHKLKPNRPRCRGRSSSAASSGNNHGDSIATHQHILQSIQDPTHPVRCDQATVSQSRQTITDPGDLSRFRPRENPITHQSCDAT